MRKCLKGIIWTAKSESVKTFSEKEPFDYLFIFAESQQDNVMGCPFKNHHSTKLRVCQLGLYHNSSAVPLLFGLLWPEDDLSLLVPLGAKLCFCSLCSCMEYSAQPRNTSTLEAQHPCHPSTTMHYNVYTSIKYLLYSPLAMYVN